ncbi:hypothetical protein Nepgr_014517 [Nepenthes gracilis]|uniref:Protein phosphatase 1 regulatory subunit 7 n=1 Tax=Nepenthes gracilis TaxID=150966 RepID=A0AAD3XQD8_NEPGR|nr:hypothetical protein Nepgr_014517 [Nepenthes gracilis]
MVRLGPEAILKDEQTSDPNSITSLSLTHKALSDVSCLGDFKNLERLDLSFNNLTSLQGLESCLKLKWLSVVMNKLQSLKGVEGLNKLTVLNAGKNMLRSMDGVQNLANLRALILNDNEISSICKLDQMKDLNTLVLSRNPVRKFHGSLAKLKSITKISLSNCELAAIDSSIKDCTELKELRLAHNDIKALPAELAHARKLQNLDLGNNLITHWSDLKVLSSLHSLKNLNLLGNPIAEKDKLMKKIKKLVPSLRIFNVKPIDKFTKNEKGNLVEDPSISAAHDLGIENRGKKKSGYGDFNRVTKEGISRNSKGLDKDKHSSQKEFEVSDKLTEERVFGQNVSALKSKLKKNSKVEESDAILTDEKELKQEQRGDHPKKKKTPKESVMSRSRDDDLDNARDDGQKGKRREKRKHKRLKF